MPESVVADLMLVITTRYEAAVAGMTQLGTAGEEMAATLTASTTAVTTESERMGEALALAGRAADESAAQVSASSTVMVDSASRASAKLEQIGIASETAATENKLAMEAMGAQTAALSAKMDLAAKKAEESNVAIGRSYAKADEAAAASTAGQAKNFGMAALAVGAVGVVAVDMAGKYEQSTNKLVTSAGESKDAIESVRQGMLGMAGQVGVSAENLSTAMYKVESAGYHGAAGLGLLKAAEQGAKAEGADGAKVADALSSAMRDYYPHAQSAADVTKYSTDVMSKLIGATSAGKMTFDELSGSLNSILPVASAAHISLDDVLGTLSSMTVHGISAEQATQNMADAVRHLQGAAQSATQSKALATIGLDANDVSQKLGERGLYGTMQMISDRIKSFMPPGSDKVIVELGTAASKSSPQVQDLANKVLNGSITMAQFSKEAKGLDPISAKQAQSFATLAASYHQLGTQQMSGADVMSTYSGLMQKSMGDATGLKVALMTTGENAEYTAGAIKTISGSTADAKGNVKGWQEVQESFNQKLSETKASLGALAINLGNALLPVIKPIIDKFAEFTGWLAQNPGIAKALAIGIGILTVALVAMTVALWAASLTPITLIIGAIVIAVGLLITGIVLLVTHWNQVWHAVGDALHAVYTAVIKPVIDAIVAAAKWVGNAFVWLWQTILKPVFDALSIAFRFIAMIWLDAVVAPIIIAVKILGAIFSWLWTNAIKPAVDAIVDAWNWFYANVIKPVADFIGLEIHVLGMIFHWLYDNAVKPVIDAVTTAWNWLYDNAIRPIGDAIGTVIHTTGAIFSWLWNNGVKPALDALGAAWNWLYDNAIRPVASFIGDAIHGVGQAFDTAFNWIKGVIQGVWNFIKPIFDAIGGAISKVSNALGGIGNMVSSTFGGIKSFLGFDDGGFVPGAPGAPMLAIVHGGEYVVSNDMQAGRAPIDPKLGVNLTGSTRASGGFGGGGGTTIVQVIVQGNVTTERQLIDAVQAGMTRTGGIRPTTYQPYRR